MITPRCYKCENELLAPGALAFSPPDDMESSSDVTKYHICAPCWAGVLDYLGTPGIHKRCLVTHAPGSSYVCWTHKRFLPWREAFNTNMSRCCCDRSQDES